MEMGWDGPGGNWSGAYSRLKPESHIALPLLYMPLVPGYSREFPRFLLRGAGFQLLLLNSFLSSLP